MRSLSRDPFARTTLVRHTITLHSAEGTSDDSFSARLVRCDWCGAVRRTKRNTPQGFRYATHDDGGRVHAHTGTFCSKSCHDSYHL